MAPAGARGAGRERTATALSAVPVLTLLGAPDCHLCHEMRRVVERVLAECGGTLVERNIREDPELERRYRLEIPVLLLGDRELVRHRVSEAALRELLSQTGAAGP